jgi:predicted TIM-barrel fold metal-dependent hydrolase
MASAQARIVDADGHVLEHPNAMLKYIPQRFKDRCWHVAIDAKGEEWLHFDGHVRPARAMALAGAGGMTLEEREACLAGRYKYSEIRNGAFNPAARLSELAIDDIEQAVVYPTQFLGISAIEDQEFAEAQAMAYNRWVAEYCAYSPRRLFGIAAIPQRDIPRAVKMLDEIRALGHVGVFLRPNPSQEGTWFWDEMYEPLWAKLEDLGLAVGLHPFLVPDMPGAIRSIGLAGMVAPGAKPNPGSSDEGGDTFGLKNIFFSQGLGNPFDMQIAMATLICGGVLERHPRMKVIFLEANGGWIVPFLERLDHHYEIFRWEVPRMKLKASEYFKRQCWISFDPDESTLRMTAESPLVGADRIIWASDYPHPDAKIPGVVDELRGAMQGLSAADQARIFGQNAIELYSLPDPS